MAFIQAVQAAGLMVAPEKVQGESPWHYLGWKITQQTICPQPLKLFVNFKQVAEIAMFLELVTSYFRFIRRTFTPLV